MNGARLAKHLLGQFQRTAGRSRTAARLAVKIKKQCEMILGQHLGSGHSFEATGEAWLLDLLAPRSANFVDVGANVGSWALAFAGAMATEPRGLLFEAAPTTAEHLRRAVRQAGLEGRLEVVEAALSDHAGEATFHAEPGVSETSSLHSSANIASAIECRVRLARLDDELASRKIAQVSVLKIDTEGHDFFVLRGCEQLIATQRVDVIQFEYNQAWLQAGATLTGAYDFLTRHGYKVRLLKPGMLGELDVRACGDFFKYTNFVAYHRSELGDLLDAQPHSSVL